MSGTGGGFKVLCRRGFLRTDISSASRPITSAEMAACKASGVKYIELPIAFDALTVVVAKNNPLNSISVEDLKEDVEPSAQGKIASGIKIESGFC